jgi:hypothetical protein
MNTPTHRTQLSGRRKLPLLIVLAVMLFAAGSARATLMINAIEVGSDVVFTLSGSVDLNSLLSTSGGPTSLAIYPSAGIVSMGGGNVVFQFLQNLSGPSNFGSGGVSLASSSAGDSFSFLAFNHYLALPPGSNGLNLSGSMTFSGATFASLGVTPGTYQWSWTRASTGVSDNLILQIGPASMPDTGSTLCMLGLGLAGMIVAARRWHFAPAVRQT